MQGMDKARQQSESSIDFWALRKGIDDWWAQASPTPEEVTRSLEQAGTILPLALLLVERESRIRVATAEVDDRLTKERDQFVADLEARAEARAAIAEMETTATAKAS